MHWPVWTRRRAILEIYGDGKLLYQSSTLYGGASAESAAILANMSLIPQDRGKITWESSDEEIASVNAYGVVTAIAEGTAVITGAGEDGDVSCTVNVVMVKESGGSSDNSQGDATSTDADGIQGEDAVSTGSDGTSTSVQADNGESSASAAVSKPGKTKLKKVKAGKKQATLSWKKTSGADGYEIWMKVGKSSYKKVKTVSAKKLKVKIKKLKSGKKYTFKVRAYRKDSSNKKIYGAFSNKKAVKVK